MTVHQHSGSHTLRCDMKSKKSGLDTILYSYFDGCYVYCSTVESCTDVMQLLPDRNQLP